MSEADPEVQKWEGEWSRGVSLEHFCGSCPSNSHNMQGSTRFGIVSLTILLLLARENKLDYNYNLREILEKSR